MQYARSMASLCLIVVVFSIIVNTTYGDNGDAEASRTKNLQFLEMTPQSHPPGDAFVARTKNLQYFEMAPQIHPPGFAYVTRTQNLQFFEMTPQMHPPGFAYVTRTRNLQYFELATTLDMVRINITSLMTTAQNQSTPQTTFTRGEIVEFHCTTTNTGNIVLHRGLIAFQVMDPSDTPVFLAYLFLDLGSLQTEETVVGYRIPMDAATGECTAEILVFSDWPSKGGIGLDIETTSFEVI